MTSENVHVAFAPQSSNPDQMSPSHFFFSLKPASLLDCDTSNAAACKPRQIDSIVLCSRIFFLRKLLPLFLSLTMKERRKRQKERKKD